MARRVVTGHDADGRAVFVDDAEIEAVEVGALPYPLLLDVWASGTVPELPWDGARPAPSRFFPAAGGYHVIVSVIMPDETRAAISDSQSSHEQLRRAMLARWPDADAGIERNEDDPGVHVTTTVDVGVVLEGECILELDDGARRRLRQGDFYVQNGTVHAWRNDTDEPCRIAIVLVGATSPPRADGE